MPATDPDLAFVLSAMVGHLFGYEAALSIDAQARPLREARAAIEAAVSAGPGQPGRPAAARPAAGHASPFSPACGKAATTATWRPRPPCGWSRCCATPPGCCRSRATSWSPARSGRRARWSTDLLDALNGGIDELTRPGRRHQAPGQDRDRRHLPQRGRPLRGAPRQEPRWPPGRPPTPSATGPCGPSGRSTRRWPRSSASPATASTGRRRAAPDHRRRRPGRDRDGSLPSRTAVGPPAAGHQAPGRRGAGGDGGAGGQRRAHRDPGAGGQGPQVTGMTLLHVRFHERLPWEAAKRVLAGTAPVTPLWPTRSPRPSRSSTMSGSATSRSSTC